MLPVEIGEMRFLRQCRPGEQMTLEAACGYRTRNLSPGTPGDLTIEARTIMQVRSFALYGDSTLKPRFPGISAGRARSAGSEMNGNRS